MKACLTIFAVLTLLIVVVHNQSAYSLQRTRVAPQWTVDLGGGWFVPSESGFDDRYKHGYNGRLALTYQAKSRVQLGAQYRFATKEAYYLPGSLDHTSHWFGARLGYDLARRWNMEASLGGVFYLVTAKLGGSQPQCANDPGCTTNIVTSNSESGFGWGLNFVYAYQVSEKFGIGFETEYNRTNLGYPTGPPVDPNNDSPYLLEYYTADNIGGFWLAPFVRLRF